MQCLDCVYVREVEGWFDGKEGCVHTCSHPQRVPHFKKVLFTVLDPHGWSKEVAEGVECTEDCLHKSVKKHL